MGVVSLILLVFAFACFLISAFWNPPNPPRFNLLSLGLACWVLSVILTTAIRT